MATLPPYVAGSPSYMACGPTVYRAPRPFIRRECQVFWRFGPRPEALFEDGPIKNGCLDVPGRKLGSKVRIAVGYFTLIY